MAHLLMNSSRHLAIELLRGPKWVQLIRFGDSKLRISRERCAEVDKEFATHDELVVERAALMFLSSYYPIAPKAKAALLGIVRQSQSEEQQMNTINIKTATTSELLAFYNANSGKDQVKRFATREAAERRVNALLGNSAAPQAAKPSNKEEAKAAIERIKAVRKAKGAESIGDAIIKAAEAKGKAKKTKKGASESSISDAVRASWSDKKVAAARSTKNHVMVAGVEYKSVRAAFAALKLPDSKHIKFRGELKAAGHATFEGHKFKVVV
jgi:hypothetical protein